ncbi:tyrosine-type recombinase/integrase [Aquincola sp. S2]|uniref:Tyrosine-type recombinase/integrase n=1 Tax=Pseudaquabacterium terrae TaxID=2732868 RepID=A0ABX2ECR9_9BURK|nr:tyrosine-type recombinase/integrase [Aquabacterium terrae]NRF65627.1 tyrosine-type recombinase/integrase [Aquabacterium terrae]
MPLVHSQTGDLFERSDSPLPAFRDGFERWLAQARHAGTLARDSSEEVYRHLWSVLTKWCVSQNPPLHLETLTAADLEAFIASRCGAEGPDQELSPRYVWRLLHLVDRVLNQRGRRLARPANLAAAELLDSRPDWRYANASDADPLPEHLNAAQARQLVDHLSQARPRAGQRPAVQGWQELRNRCAVALQLGAGLGPGDVRGLTLSSVVIAGGRRKDLPWKLQVEATGSAPAHEAPIAAWAGLLLRHWLEVRAHNGIAGEQLFPSTKSGKPWGKVAQYQAVKQVLGAAGFDHDVVRGGSFRLRHTFALRQLRRGRSVDEVARWLGIVDAASMSRYQRVLYAPVDDVI